MRKRIFPTTLALLMLVSLALLSSCTNTTSIQPTSEDASTTSKKGVYKSIMEQMTVEMDTISALDEESGKATVSVKIPDFTKIYAYLQSTEGNYDTSKSLEENILDCVYMEDMISTVVLQTEVIKVDGEWVLKSDEAIDQEIRRQLNEIAALIINEVGTIEIEIDDELWEEIQ